MTHARGRREERTTERAEGETFRDGNGVRGFTLHEGFPHPLLPTIPFLPRLEGLNYLCAPFPFTSPRLPLAPPRPPAGRMKRRRRRRRRRRLRAESRVAVSAPSDRQWPRRPSLSLFGGAFAADFDPSSSFFRSEEGVTFVADPFKKVIAAQGADWSSLRQPLGVGDKVPIFPYEREGGASLTGGFSWREEGRKKS